MNFAVSMLKKAILKPGKESSILRRHPWVFSGAIQNTGNAKPGDWVELYTSSGKYICSGHWGDGSIALRILTYNSETPELEFWTEKLKNCVSLRKEYIDSSTTAYRLVHGEGDFLPGLIIDIYDNCAVIQAHSHGMFNSMNLIGEALNICFENKLDTIYCKSAATMHGDGDDRFLHGSKQECIATEYGMKFNVNWVEGQKTGFFLDQRENRALLKKYAAGKHVLNTFCYSGGFSVAALQGDAASVTSIDVSSKAIDLTRSNLSLNGYSDEKNACVAEDVNHFLKTNEQLFDIVILDPPAFAKSLRKKHNAVMGYKRLNTAGIAKVKPGGLLFTFSCSQVIDEALFANTIVAAALETGRKARILHRLGQGPDHPVNLFHPEGHYLKGLVLKLDD